MFVLQAAGRSYSGSGLTVEDGPTAVGGQRLAVNKVFSKRHNSP